MPQSTQSPAFHSTEQYVHYLQQQMMRVANSSDRPSSHKLIGIISTQARMAQASVQQPLICQEVLYSRRTGKSQ